MAYDKERVILELIGQYDDISDGGGVAPFMLAHWLDMTRQGASYHLRRMVQDGLLQRVEYDYRDNVKAFRYHLSEKTNEFYQDGQFKRAYNAWVYGNRMGEFFDKMVNKR